MYYIEDLLNQLNIDRGLAKLAEDFEIDVVLCLYIKNWLNKRNCHALYESMVGYVGNRIKLYKIFGQIRG